MQTNRGKYYIFSVGSKVVAVHAMKAYRESGFVAPLILNLGSRGRSVVNFTLRPLHLLGNKSGIHWVGPRSGLDGLGREKNLLSQWNPKKFEPNCYDESTSCF
jgi:hypothetical protein